MSAPLSIPAASNVSSARSSRRGRGWRALLATTIAFAGLAVVAPAPAQADAQCLPSFSFDSAGRCGREYSYTGSTVDFVPPAGVTSFDVVLKGAAGGSFSGPREEVAGGRGGVLSGTVAVPSGSPVYKLLVGRQPDEKGGTSFGGGGASDGERSGGGGSFVFVSAGVGAWSPVAVAGGGGAAYDSLPGGDGSGGSAASDGGGGAGEPGRGATSDAPGAGSPPGTGPAQLTADGSQLTAGMGGSSQTGSLGGGGGGGYFGGGAGFSRTAGGGGSGYHSNAVTSVDTTAFNPGDGSITITYTPPAPATEPGTGGGDASTSGASPQTPSLSYTDCAVVSGNLVKACGLNSSSDVTQWWSFSSPNEDYSSSGMGSGGRLPVHTGAGSFVLWPGFESSTPSVVSDSISQTITGTTANTTYSFGFWANLGCNPKFGCYGSVTAKVSDGSTTVTPLSQTPNTAPNSSAADSAVFGGWTYYEGTFTTDASNTPPVITFTEEANSAFNFFSVPFAIDDVAFVPVASPVTAPVAKEAGSLADLRDLVDESKFSNACGGTVKLTAPIDAGADGSPLDDVTAACGSQPVTLDLNGQSLTLRQLSKTGNGTLTIVGSTPGTMSLGDIELFVGRVVVGEGATVTAVGREVSDSKPDVNSNSEPPNLITVADVWPGVTFRFEDTSFEVAGGTVVAKSPNVNVPALGGMYHDENGTGTWSGALGSVRVSSGSLTLYGFAGFAPALDLRQVQAGASSAPIVSTTGTGSLVIAQGLVDLPNANTGGDEISVDAGTTLELRSGASIARNAGTVGGAGTVVNRGAILQQPSKITVPTITGNNFSVTFDGFGDPVRVLAKSFNAAGATFPKGNWKVGSTVLTASTDLTTLGGTANDSTGVTPLTAVAYTPVTVVSTATALRNALQSTSGTAGSPLFVQLARPWTGGDVAGLTVGSTVSLDLNGQTVRFGDVTIARDVEVGPKSLTFTDSAAGGSKGSATLGATTVASGGRLSMQGSRIVMGADNAMTIAGGGTLSLDASAVLDASAGSFATTASVDNGAGPTPSSTVTNDGTIKVSSATTILGSISGNAFGFTFDVNGGSGAASSQLVLAKSASAAGVVLPTPTAPADQVFEGWYYTSGDSTPAKVESTTDVAALVGAATGTTKPVALKAKYTPLPAQDWSTIPPILAAPATGKQLTATISPAPVSAGPDSVSWVWEREVSSTSTGSTWEPIAGATGNGNTASYTPKAADLGSRLRVVFMAVKEGFATRRIEVTSSSATVQGLITSIEDLTSALQDCSGPLRLTLGADIRAELDSIELGCAVTLDLAGFDLKVAQIKVPPVWSLTVTDSAEVRGLLTVDGSKASPSGSPFVLDANELSIDARVALGGAQEVPAGAKLSVLAGGVVSKAAGAELASITGSGTVDNAGVIGAGVTPVQVKTLTGDVHAVTFHLPEGSDPATVTVRVLGTSLDSVGASFPEITGLKDDEYVRWGTAPDGGSKVLGSTALTGSTLALYPTIVKKGTELVSSAAELTAALAATSQAGAPRTVKLARSISEGRPNVVVPEGPTGVGPVRLDLNGFGLVANSIHVSGPGLTVDDSKAAEAGASAELTVVQEVLLDNATLEVSSGRVSASSSQATVLQSPGRSSRSAVRVTGGLLRVEVTGAGKAASLRPLVAGEPAISVTGGELQVLGLDTSKASLAVGPLGRVTALAPRTGSTVPAISGAVPVVNDGVIVGESAAALAGVTAPVVGNNAVVSFATAGGELPAGAATSVRALAGSLGATGVAALPVPTRGLEGQWVFAGWKVLGDVPTAFTTSTVLPQSTGAGAKPGAVTVTAQWTPQSLSVTTAGELLEALAAGWPIVTIPAGTRIDLGESSLDLGASRLVVAAGASLTGSAVSSITGGKDAVIQNSGTITVPVRSGGESAYAGSFRGDAFAVTYGGLSGASSTVRVLGASVSAVGGSLPAGPVVPGKRFVGWSLTEQTGPEGANPSPSVISAASRLGEATTVDGPLTGVTLFPVYADRPAVTEVDSVEGLIEALSCANGITAPVKIAVSGDLVLDEPVETGCAASLELSGGTVRVDGDLVLGGDLTVSGGRLQLLEDLVLGTHTLSIAPTGVVTGSVLTSRISRVVDGEGAGKVLNSGVLVWPNGLGVGADAVPVEGRHYAVSFTVPAGVETVTARTVYAGSVAAADAAAGVVGQQAGLPVPTRPGFTFTGWNTKADGTGTVITAASDLTALGVSEDGAPVVVQLFAQYVAIPIGGGGSPTASPTASPTSNPTATPTPTASSTPTVLPTAEPTLVVDPITGGGSTGGEPQVGVPVTVDVTVPDVPGATVGFQWQVVLPDGTVVDVPGATGETYTPSGEYAGYGLQVVVTISAPGYAPSVQVVSFPRTQPVRPGVIGEFTIDRKVRGGVQEHPLVGQKVMAKLPKDLRASLPQGAVLDYQWSKGRKPIRGVNGSRRVIEVGEGMVGRKLRLVLTVTAPGYDTLTVTAPKTRIVKPTGWTGKKKDPSS